MSEYNCMLLRAQRSRKRSNKKSEKRLERMCLDYSERKEAHVRGELLLLIPPVLGLPACWLLVAGFNFKRKNPIFRFSIFKICWSAHARTSILASLSDNRDLFRVLLRQ